MARVRSAPRLSLRLLRVAGIDVRLHLTTLLLFGWILFEHARTGDWASVAEGSALVACVFISIVLHELGHHVDRITSKSQATMRRGEAFAEAYANELLSTIWPAYLRIFGDPRR